MRTPHQSHTPSSRQRVCADHSTSAAGLDQLLAAIPNDRSWRTTPPRTLEHPKRYQMSENVRAAYWLSLVGVLTYVGHFLVIGFWIDWLYARLQRGFMRTFGDTSERQQASVKPANTFGDLLWLTFRPGMVFLYLIDTILVVSIRRRRTAR